mgnify:CR=1 FL=1
MKERMLKFEQSRSVLRVCWRARCFVVSDASHRMSSTSLFLASLLVVILSSLGSKMSLVGVLLFMPLFVTRALGHGELSLETKTFVETVLRSFLDRTLVLCLLIACT